MRLAAPGRGGLSQPALQPTTASSAGFVVCPPPERAAVVFASAPDCRTRNATTGGSSDQCGIGGAHASGSPIGAPTTGDSAPAERHTARSAHRLLRSSHTSSYRTVCPGCRLRKWIITIRATLWSREPPCKPISRVAFIILDRLLW